MKPVPLSLREANDFVSEHHRHNGRTSRDGGKFAIGAATDEGLVGVAIVGRPLARLLNDSWTAEVLRCCTNPACAPKGTCSFLYGRCWRIWQQMGGLRMVTYTLANEGGASLRAENAALREALGFYGDPDTWFGVALFSDPPCGEIMDDISNVVDADGIEVERPGKRAREALEEDT